MNIEEFDNFYADKKCADKIEIDCDHPDHDVNNSKTRTIGKTAARRNILKNDGQKFVCRDCFMRFDNPMNKVGKSRQTDDVISVQCPKCDKVREMKKSCYYGLMETPYLQMCGGCAQTGKIISEEQKEKIRATMTGRALTDEHIANMKKWWSEHPDDPRKKNLMVGNYNPLDAQNSN